MEHTYDVTEREGLCTIGVAFLLFGLAFGLVGLGLALGFLGTGGSQLPTAVVPTLVGSLAAYLGWDHLFRQPWLIRTQADGTVEIRRALRSTRLPASAICALERRGRVVGVEGGDARILKLVHTGGTIPITCFPEIEAFIADIRALNPAVILSGEWKIGRG